MRPIIWLCFCALNNEAASRLYDEFGLSCCEMMHGRRQTHVLMWTPFSRLFDNFCSSCWDIIHGVGYMPVLQEDAKLHVIYIFVLLVLQVKLREMKPGLLSHELKEALGMPDGAPPPWLINMQVSLANFMHLVYVICSLTLNFPSEIWSSTVIPTSQDPWTECSYSPWSKLWLSSWWLGQASCWWSM